MAEEPEDYVEDQPIARFFESSEQTNENDEPANVVDGLYAIADAINKLTHYLRGGD